MAVKIGLVGTGTVGGGCIDIIKAHKEEFLRHYGIDIELVAVSSLNPEQAAAHGVSKLFTPDFMNIINDPDIDIVIELIGGTTVAHTVVTEALKAGKNVVTANKALMATYGVEIMELAREQHKELAFEASVGGGIPIIGPLKHSLIANKITQIMGIVNGTTNYMLTRMDEAGLSYDEALAEAQANGFAEANPSADVDGFDAAAKIAILASIAFNTNVSMDQVYTEGIRDLSAIDMATAKELGYALKLLAIANLKEDGVEVRVHPTMLPLEHQLAQVKGVFNAIWCVGDFVGETMYFGEGAGAGAAASAVMGDVLEVARHVQQGILPMSGNTTKDELEIIPMDELSTKYYLHLVVHDQAGVLAKSAAIFANYGVSISAMMQKGKQHNGAVDLVYITHHASEKAIRQAVEDIVFTEGILANNTRPVVIRVQE
ncbi:MAG: homoserine dehydrogenase [Coriobacteriia bacterium]|nr:homoserine dehydrogenase [Coriobacteriia bacterium]